MPTFSYKIRRLTRAIKASISAAILDTCEVKEAFCEVKLAISTPILETIETKEAFCVVGQLVVGRLVVIILATMVVHNT